MKIPKIKRLPSGAYNCRVRVGGAEYSITDYDKNKVYAQAVAYKAGLIKAKRQPERITVKEAVERYIDDRSNVLSPSTLRAYRGIIVSYGRLLPLYVDNITAREIQRWVNAHALAHTAKTTKNAYSLLHAALDAAGVDKDELRARLPEVRQTPQHTPTEAEIRRLIAAVRGTSLELPVYLAAFGSLRRGEICALTRDDVTDTGVWVTKAVVKSSSGAWVTKATKERSSDRHALLPSKVVVMLKGLPPGAPITELSPNALSLRFLAAMKANNIPHFRFHDLRAYWATVAHAMGMADYYIMRNGGWSSMTTPRKHYLRNAEELNQTAQNAAQNHFSELLIGDDFGDEN